MGRGGGGGVGTTLLHSALHPPRFSLAEGIAVDGCNGFHMHDQRKEVSDT